MTCLFFLISMVSTRFLATLATIGIAASSFVSSAGAFFADDFQHMLYQPVLPTNVQPAKGDEWPRWIGRLGARYAGVTTASIKKVTQIRTGTHTSLYDQVDEEWPSWIGRLR